MKTEIYQDAGPSGTAQRPTWRLSSHASNRAVIAALLIVYIVWGTTYHALNVAMVSMPPLTLNATRFAAAAALMAMWVAWRAHRTGAPAQWPTPRQWLHAALIGSLMGGAAMSLVVLAQKAGIGSGLMATVVTTMPMWLALWSRLGGETVGRLRWVGLALGVAGAAVLTLEGDFAATPTGAVLAFAAPLCWSVGSYWSRKLSLPPAREASAAQWAVAGLVGCALAAGAEPGGLAQMLHATTWSWLAWAYLVGAGTLLTLSAYLWLLQHTHPALAGSYAFVNPIVALGVGVWLGGEQLSGWVFAALPLIGAGLALLLYAPTLAARRPY
jgi:drug/metabolite transporter (DMT)-like permease